MAAIPGNLPTNPDQTQNTTTFFNNFYTQTPSISDGANSTVIAYFQQITGTVEAGRTLAGAVIYTATQQGIDPISLVEELKKISDKNKQDIAVLTPLTQSVIIEYATYQEIVANISDYTEGQLYYIPALNVFYQLTSDMIKAVNGYQADVIFLQDEIITYNFSKVSYTSGKYSQRTVANAADTDVYNNGTWTSSGNQYANAGPSKASNDISELNAYLTMFLNLNRSGTSLLGLSNSPQTSKYITRTILA